MDSKDLIIASLQLSYSLVYPLLEDMKSAPLFAPCTGGNHTHWILGHLLHSEGQFRKIMRDETNPVDSLRQQFAGGTSPDPEGNGYPDYAQMLSQLVAQRQETLNWVNSLSEFDLDHPSAIVPPGFEPFFGTWRNALNMISLHWMNHRGQIADCRRAAGRAKMMA